MEPHAHLKRLERVWIESPIYFVTTCTNDRTPLLANPCVANILEEEWLAAYERHRWAIGRYVIMPDHVHFFCSACELAAKPLSQFMQKWKEWTSKRIKAYYKDKVGPKVWQNEFFDHMLRSQDSYGQKWEYVRENPVRAGLVNRADDWKFQGEIYILEKQ